MNLKVYKEIDDCMNSDKEFHLFDKDSERSELVEEGKLEGRITAKLQLESGYGPILRLHHWDMDKTETRVQIKDYENKIAEMKPNQFEREWVVETVKECGFEVEKPSDRSSN